MSGAKSEYRKGPVYYIKTNTLGEMQDYYEERSESWQESDRGEEHQEKVASVEVIVDALSDLLS